jgi:hypothetical protein
MEFHDFQIRAWTVDRKHAAVLVHSSPSGAMQRPEHVDLDLTKLSAFRNIFNSNSELKVDDVATLVAGGRGLANVLFPDHVVGMLVRSLERIDPEDGLRVRLCLDSVLSDLPWEYLILPDVAGLKSLNGFLALDARVSLVREPPKPGRQRSKLQKKLRLLFFGTRLCSTTGEDLFETARARDTLFKALEPASSVLDARAILSNETDCQTALMRSNMPIDIFHYSGHADLENGTGYLIANDIDQKVLNYDRLYAGTLGSLLRRAGTTIAVFSACNSGNWAFVEPVLQSEVPVVVAAQGMVYVDVAIAFCQRLYSALALGLSLDEAVTWARLHLLEPGVLQKSLQWQWGIFTVYMQTAEAVLFPRSRITKVSEQQNAARQARQSTIINVTQNIGSIQGGTVAGVSARDIATQVHDAKADGGDPKIDG